MLGLNSTPPLRIPISLGISVALVFTPIRGMLRYFLAKHFCDPRECEIHTG
jgi:hypothetical protein